MRIKYLTGIIVIFILSVLLVGCGAEKPKDAADATVKAYMEMYATNDKTNGAKTGQAASEIDKIIQGNTQGLKQAFAGYEITDAQQTQLVQKYFDTIKQHSNIQTKIKTASDTEPVVEVSMNRLDNAQFSQMMQSDEGLQQIGFVKGMIQAGQSDATMQDYQSAVTDRLALLIENMPFKADVETLDVPCQIAKGEGDKTFWSPKDMAAVANFAGGK